MTENKKKYCIIHGHFYQPPREDPWMEEIELQPSASPFHNWNERIFDECYRPNSFSRIFNERSEVVGVSNNYSYMSFNFGPTLFRWLCQKHYDVYERIVEADKRSCAQHNGHGNAIAQVYNHLILPHASRKDKLTQIRWGKSFFKRHFGRETEGIWLAETAINMETIECLVEEKIRFVVLSPNQAEFIRTTTTNDDGTWTPTSEHGLDPRFPYRCFVEDESGRRNGKYINIFFFDEPLSRQISFDNFLDNADILAEKINGCYSHDLQENEVVNLATDGETFGHHKKNADMCLAYFFRTRAAESDIHITNYAHFLAENPPVREVRLKNAHGEGTAWSCAHGTGRWIRDCGCSTGGLAGWNQKWRGPLREALERLHSEINRTFITELAPYFDDPARIRDLYEPFIEDQTDLGDFLHEQAKQPIPENIVERIIMLLEAQRHILFSFTSCAWFFNDISGIETVQNLRHALRAWQLAWPEQNTNYVLENFLATLETAHSNLPNTNGRTLVEKDILPIIHHLERAAFTAAVNYYIYGENSEKYCFGPYNILIERCEKQHYNDREWQLFTIDVSHAISHEKRSMILALFNSRGHNIEGIVFPPEMRTLLVDRQNGLARLMAMADRCEIRFSLSDVFPSYRDYITQHFVDEFASKALPDYLSWTGMQGNRLDAITELNGGLPTAFAETVTFFLNKEWDIHVGQMVKQENSRGLADSLHEVARKAKHYGIVLNKVPCADLLFDSVVNDLRNLRKKPHNQKTVDMIMGKLNVAHDFEIPVHFCQLQDRFYLIYKYVMTELYPKWNDAGNPQNRDRETIIMINQLARRFGFNTDATAV